MKMIDSNYYIEQLDILSAYMSYWIEFRDKERIRFDKVLEKEMPSINESIAIVNAAFGDNDMESTTAVKRKRPLEFESVIKTFDRLLYKSHRDAKEQIINSIHKFV